MVNKGGKSSLIILSDVLQLHNQMKGKCIKRILTGIESISEDGSVDPALRKIILDSINAMFREINSHYGIVYEE